MPVSFLGSHIKAGNVPCLLGGLAAAGGRSAVEMFFTEGIPLLGPVWSGSHIAFGWRGCVGPWVSTPGFCVREAVGVRAVLA